MKPFAQPVQIAHGRLVQMVLVVASHTIIMVTIGGTPSVGMVPTVIHIIRIIAILTLIITDMVQVGEILIVGVDLMDGDQVRITVEDVQVVEALEDVEAANKNI